MAKQIGIIFLLFTLTSNYLLAQYLIKGSVKDDKKAPIELASIWITASDSEDIIAFTYSEKEGNYQLELRTTGAFRISFSALAHEKKAMTVEVSAAQPTATLHVVLSPVPFEFEEVLIKAESLPIVVKGDTVIVDVKAFAQGNEAVVEDLLKKIPGLNIDAAGNIKVGNKEIEKVMVEGDDFFEKGYKILTKNMPSAPVEKIEILQNYSNNRLLKGIEQSDRVALNLRLKEEAKRVWFGDISAGYDITLADRYNIQGNLMNFGKKNKYYFITNLNNIGQDATGDIEHLIRPFRYDEPASVGDDQQAHRLLNLAFAAPDLKSSRTNLNNAELLSLNAIFNPTAKLKIKTLGFFDANEVDFFRNSKQDFTASGTNFTNIENQHFRNASVTGFGKLDLTYDISTTRMFESTTKYNRGGENGHSNLLFNNLSTIENIQTNHTLFDQKITFSNKFQQDKALLLTGRFIQEVSPQNYTINRFLYQDLFPNQPHSNNVQQLNDHTMQFAGLESHFLHRKSNKGLLETQLGSQWRKDQMFTALLMKEGDVIITNDFNAFQNDVSYSTTELYIKSKYRHQLKNFALQGSLGIHQLFNHLDIGQAPQEQSSFFINPAMGFDWEINKKNTLSASYAFNTTNATILDVFDRYVLTSFRSFDKGTGGFNQLDASTFTINHRVGNWSEHFFANTMILYQKNHDFFSNNTFVTPNYALSEKIIIKDRSFFNITSNIDTYIKLISSNIKLDLGYSTSNFKNIVNNSEWRVVNTNNYHYGVELRSGFENGFNFHLGTKWTTSAIKAPSFNNTFTNNLTFFDLFFSFSSHLDVQLQSERYYFGNLDNNNTYYFFDFDINYTIQPKRWTLSLIGKNLFNTNTFTSFSINDLGTAVTTYRLLPRFALLQIKYQF
ncbi:MAG: carboxypeptidase regulatory-like domain-containing protein [Saprospiraceae bacterium]